MRLYPAALVLLVTIAGCSNSASSHSKPTPNPTTQGLRYTFPTATPGGKKRGTAVPGATLPVPAGIRTATPAAPVHFAASAYTAVVFGTVTDRKTRQPLAGARVTVADGQKTAQTDASGRYRVGFPAKAAASIQVQKKGYQCGLAMGTLKPGQSVKKDWLCDKLSPKHPLPPPFPSLLGTPGAAPGGKKTPGGPPPAPGA